MSWTPSGSGTGGWENRQGGVAGKSLKIFCFGVLLIYLFIYGKTSIYNTVNDILIGTIRHQLQVYTPYAFIFIVIVVVLF